MTSTAVFYCYGRRGVATELPAHCLEAPEVEVHARSLLQHAALRIRQIATDLLFLVMPMLLEQLRDKTSTKFAIVAAVGVRAVQPYCSAGSQNSYCYMLFASLLSLCCRCVEHHSVRVQLRHCVHSC